MCSLFVKYFHLFSARNYIWSCNVTRINLVLKIAFCRLVHVDNRSLEKATELKRDRVHMQGDVTNYEVFNL